MSTQQASDPFKELILALDKAAASCEAVARQFSEATQEVQRTERPLVPRLTENTTQRMESADV